MKEDRLAAKYTNAKDPNKYTVASYLDALAMILVSGKLGAAAGVCRGGGSQE